jgi:hypothetical protein
VSDEETALAKRDDAGPRVPDAYAREFMDKDGGALLHHARRPAPKFLQALLGLPALMGLVMLATPAWVTGLWMVPLGVLMWALFSVLRVSVTEQHLHVQYGLFGPKIPVNAIESAEAVDYNAMKFGGWGIKRSLDGEWIYNMPGDGGRALKVVWRDGKGKQRTTYIGMPQPEPAAAAVAQAQRALPPGEDTPALASTDQD